VLNLATLTRRVRGLSPGAVGVWFGDQYCSVAKAVPNALAATGPSLNMFRGSRRVFANTEFWGVTSTTCTDSAATAPDGSNDASTFVGTGGWIVHPANGGTIAAGNYTVAANVKRNTGTDQAFAFTSNNTSTRDVHTATSSWQRFSYTFVAGGAGGINSVGICSSDGATNGNIQVCDFELYAGSLDLGPQTYAGHLYLGSSPLDATPSFASGEINLSTGGYGLIQFPAASTYASFTAMALTRKVAAGSSYHAFLSKLQSYSTFTAYTELSSVPEYAGGAGDANLYAGVWVRLNQAKSVITHRYDAATTTHTIWLDDAKLFSLSSAMSSFTMADLACGFVSTTALPCKEKITSMALWNRALNDLEVRDSVAALQARAARVDVSASSHARIVAFEGDSISGGFSYSYPFKFGANASPVVLANVFATSGQTLAGLNTRAATVDAVLPPIIARVGRRFILTVLIGANDLNGYAGATDAIAAASYTADLAAYCDARRQAGWYVIVCTLLPRDPVAAANYNARRNIVNSNITGSWVGLHCDAIADFGADATVGGDAAASPASGNTYYADGLHPTDAGQVILEGIIRTKINAVPA
jgi:lysophospholipase L1-like esterase